ncbi:MAG: hypothetical protein BGO09_10910 [Bacteroidetes bacterium 47-18]|nr:MAG: hypothetical protein BGO09_10910 [Bacteroidetes bacterium 47-18]
MGFAEQCTLYGSETTFTIRVRWGARSFRTDVRNLLDDSFVAIIQVVRVNILFGYVDGLTSVIDGARQQRRYLTDRLVGRNKG